MTAALRAASSMALCVLSMPTTAATWHAAAETHATQQASAAPDGPRARHTAMDAGASAACNSASAARRQQPAHLLGEREPDGAGAAADVQQQRLRPDRSHAADAVVKQAGGAWVDLPAAAVGGGRRLQQRALPCMQVRRQGRRARTDVHTTPLACRGRRSRRCRLHDAQAPATRAGAPGRTRWARPGTSARTGRH